MHGSKVWVEEQIEDDAKPETTLSSGDTMGEREDSGFFGLPEGFGDSAALPVNPTTTGSLTDAPATSKACVVKEEPTLPPEPKDTTYVAQDKKAPPKPWSRLWPGDAILLAIAVACNADPDVHMVNALARLLSMLPAEVALSPQLVCTGQRGHMYCCEYEFYLGYPAFEHSGIYSLTLKKQQASIGPCHLGHMLSSCGGGDMASRVRDSKGRVAFVAGLFGNLALALQYGMHTDDPTKNPFLDSTAKKGISKFMLSGLYLGGHADVLRILGNQAFVFPMPTGVGYNDGPSELYTPIRHAVHSRSKDVIRHCIEHFIETPKALETLAEIVCPHSLFKEAIERYTELGKQVDAVQLWSSALGHLRTNALRESEDPLLNLKYIEDVLGLTPPIKPTFGDGTSTALWSKLHNIHIIGYCLQRHNFTPPPIVEFVKASLGYHHLLDIEMLALLLENDIIYNPSDTEIEDFIAACGFQRPTPANQNHFIGLNWYATPKPTCYRRVLEAIIRQRKQQWMKRNDLLGVDEETRRDMWSAELQIAFWYKFPWLHSAIHPPFIAILLRLGAPVNADLGDGYPLDVQEANREELSALKYTDGKEAHKRWMEGIEMIRKAGGKQRRIPNRNQGKAVR